MFLRLSTALIREDLPTFERPAKAISGRLPSGSWLRLAAPSTNSTGPMQSLRPASSVSSEKAGRSLIYSAGVEEPRPSNRFINLSSSVSTPFRRMMKYCCPSDRMFDQTQYRTSPAANPPNTNMNTNGKAIMMVRWVGSGGGGDRDWIPAMVTPYRIGRIPIPITNPRIGIAFTSAAAQGKSPKRLPIAVGSGADRSLMNPNGVWRISIVTYRVL
mmetsp:Transcript_34778/g.44873  ORF Transcript_34778/g.44873 Transcript_34778/m.44873 type:complete len:215 (+) Transcript_34778:194-838(+)